MPVPAPDETEINDTGYRRMALLYGSTFGAFVCQECGAVVGAPDQHNDWHDDPELAAILAQS